MFYYDAAIIQYTRILCLHLKLKLPAGFSCVEINPSHHINLHFTPTSLQNEFFGHASVLWCSRI